MSSAPDHSSTAPVEPTRVIGRYRISEEIAAGGMATVHLGRLLGPAGFTRTVAIKRLHPQFAKDEDFSEMFIDEARIAARIRHPNALTALDVVSAGGELYIVMDYIHGESLGRLVRGEPAPLPIVVAIISQALLGLHAAHEALDDDGRALSIVHRDVSPQNILVGVDGVVRVVDFGIAKAASRVHTTAAGTIKGKVAYMSPQQLQGEDIDRRADIFAIGVVLWEAIVGRRLLSRGDGTVARVLGWRGLEGSDLSAVPAALHGVLQRALARDPARRFLTAREMAVALVEADQYSSSLQVGEWVEKKAAIALERRAKAVSDMEREVVGARAPLSATGSESPTAVIDITNSALSASTRNDLPSPSRKRAHPAVTAGLGTLLLFAAYYALRPMGTASVVALDPVHYLAVATEAPKLPMPQLADSSALQVHDLATPPPQVRPAASSATIAPSFERPRTVASARPVSTKLNCSPRFNIDQNGIKHFKPECFR